MRVRPWPLKPYPFPSLNYLENPVTKAIFTPAIDCTNEQRPFIALTSITSNKLHAVGYCPERKIFAAQFAPGGAIYHYEGFTAEQHQEFLAAESKGRHFGQHVQCLPSKKYFADPAPTAEAPAATDEPAPATAAELEAAGQERLVG